MAGVWIVAERREQARELLGIGRQLADQSTEGLTVVLLRDREGAAGCISHGADEVLLAPALSEGESLDALIPVISEEVRSADPSLVLIPATYRGKAMAARIAARLDTGLCSGCTGLAYSESTRSVEMERLAYGGAAVQKLKGASRPTMAAIPPRTFEPAPETPGRQWRTRDLPAPAPSTVRIVGRKAKEREAKDISQARVVVCVGRGFEKKEDLALAGRVAEAVGGEIAGTRPITEEMHWLPGELCIGISGISVKPELYIGLGVSGQIQHVTGISRAKVIAAVNRDDKAPIFGAADLGIVGDLYDVVPKLAEELKNVTKA